MSFRGNDGEFGCRWVSNSLAAFFSTLLVADGDYDPVEEAQGPKAVFSFSAVLAEVRVDPDLGLVRLSGFVGAYDTGRIINPKTARSQAIGGIIGGAGQALLEQSETDLVMGRFLNRNYSGYLVTTNADIPELDILFLGEFDEEATPLRKSLGELAAVPVAPAIANALYHATGTRVHATCRRKVVVMGICRALLDEKGSRPCRPKSTPFQRYWEPRSEVSLSLVAPAQTSAANLVGYFTPPHVPVAISVARSAFGFRREGIARVAAADRQFAIRGGRPQGNARNDRIGFKIRRNGPGALRPVSD